jgi:ABC-type uncharacterized transport system substrate-binding protein
MRTAATERKRPYFFWGSAAGFLLLVCSTNLYPLQTRPSTVAVLAAPDVEAYVQAIGGLKSGMGNSSTAIRVFPLEKRGGKSAIPGALVKEAHSVVVAMGSEAARALSESPVDAPVLYTMALRADSRLARSGRQKTVSTITLDVPMDALAARLKEIFPGKVRLGVVRQTEWPGPSVVRLQADARQAGLVLVVAECQRAEDLLRVFLSLKDKVDFVWCLPDSSLYNSATVQALLIASLNNQIPVVGFSASFVRAGALMGVYADFRDIGSQTADVIQNYLGDRPVASVQSPRTFEVAVNQRVSRLLGLQPALAKEVVLFR